MDVFLLALLTTLNAAFAMSEMALSTSRRARLAALAETGAVSYTHLTLPTILLV